MQFTPPGSQASIQFGEGTTTMEPGSLQGLLLVVDDIVAAREDLIARGAEVSEIWHAEPGKGRVEGLDPQRRSYSSRATFADPDGNAWLLQEVTERLPGRVESDGLAALAELLHETADPPRRLRGGRPAARLVGLVRGLPGRARARKHPGRGRRGRRALHGGGQARRRRPA